MAPSQHPSSEFSFDLYPGLDAELDAALERNQADGIASPEVLATRGLEHAINDTLNRTRPNGLHVSPEVHTWADARLEQAKQKWSRHDSIVLPDLEASHPNLATVLTRLYEAQKALAASGRSTPNGVPIGGTMSIVLIPWQLFRDHSAENLTDWLNPLRLDDNISQGDYMNTDLGHAIKNSRPLYGSQSARDYLDAKIASDGPWGIGLIQTSDEAGLQNLFGQSPDDLRAGINVDGHDVGQLGIYEWLATTLQEDPRTLSTGDYSWMLANRLTVNGVAQVPCGGWLIARVGSGLGDADYRDGNFRPRLAVI